MSEIERAEQTWDEMDTTTVRSVAWLGVMAVTADIWGSFSAGRGPVAKVAELLVERGKVDDLVGAALVCGDMQSERSHFEHSPGVHFREVHGYDISQASLDRYTPDGIAWVPHKADCNRLDLPEEHFDLVVASHGAHHVMELDRLFAEARRSLRPRGLLYMYEWVGPPYLRIPRRNRAIAALLLLALFPRRRTRRTHMNRVKGLRWVLDGADPAIDPSEACNSLELYPAYRRHFEPVVEYFHGGLSYPMFEGIAQNFDQSRPGVRRRLAWAVRIERRLTAWGLVHPLFVVAVGERKA